jgi:hypothetical protein
VVVGFELGLTLAGQALYHLSHSSSPPQNILGLPVLRLKAELLELKEQ